MARPLATIQGLDGQAAGQVRALAAIRTGREPLLPCAPCSRRLMATRTASPAAPLVHDMPPQLRLLHRWPCRRCSRPPSGPTSLARHVSGAGRAGGSAARDMQRSWRSWEQLERPAACAGPKGAAAAALGRRQAGRSSQQGGSSSSSRPAATGGDRRRWCDAPPCSLRTTSCAARRSTATWPRTTARRTP